MKASSILSVVYQQYQFYEDQVVAHKLVKTGQQGNEREGSVHFLGCARQPSGGVHPLLMTGFARCLLPM